MTEEQILYGNELIAKFIGAKYKEGWSDKSIDPMYHFEIKPNFKPNELSTFDYQISFMEFHSSWDWLMPVVGKIESIDLSEYMYKWTDDEETHYNFCGIFVEIEKNKCMIYMELSLDPIRIINKETTQQKYNSKIESVYFSVIEFIEWYNKYI